LRNDGLEVERIQKMTKMKRKAGGRLLMLKANREPPPTKVSSKPDTCGRRANEERFGI
jgi:hypothetical protein